MPTPVNSVEALATQEYKYGFYTDVEADLIPPGLNEDIIRLISAKKNEPAWMLEWRLKSYRHWLTMTEPKWANIKFGPIDYQTIHYYSAPRSLRSGSGATTHAPRAGPRRRHRSSACRARCVRPWR